MHQPTHRSAVSQLMLRENCYRVRMQMRSPSRTEAGLAVEAHVTTSSVYLGFHSL